MRVRYIDERYLLQIKTPVFEEGALHIKKEYEEEADGVPEVISFEKLKKITGKNMGDAYLIGALKTVRCELTWGNGVTVCLDKNEYLGITDYEIEVEYINSIDKHLYNALCQVGVEFRSDVKGKYSRFMDRLLNYGS